MSSDPEARKRSLAALERSRTTWKPGQSGNPNGRPVAGASYAEHLNLLVGKLEAEVRAIARDKDAPVHQRMAAKTTLRALTEAYHKGIPKAGNDLDRICDRTKGKPHQSLHVHRTETRPPAAIIADKAPLLVQAYASLPPAERARVLEQMQGLIPPVVDAEPAE